ncbi:hypothetical protein V1264_009107 [Littorina saxatilis]|uniref:SOCS box domain-containing protein n=3 Tax=Littorina saxatilis TaxID=31220 RepID=A0AAN9AQQ5_9CAEN
MPKSEDMNTASNLVARLRVLHDVIKKGDVTALKAFLDSSQNPGDVNAALGSHTAMMCALENCPDDVIPMTLLQQADFDPNAKTRRERGALHEAARLGRDTMLLQLLRVGADVNMCDHYGVTPMAVSAKENRASTTRILLAYGASVNVQDSFGNTPLNCACAAGSQEVVCILLDDPGYDVMTVDNRKKTDLSSALPSAYNVQVCGQSISRALSICRRMLWAGCDVASTNPDFRVLHERVIQNDLAGASLLLHHRPSLADLVDPKGTTPLELAVKRRSYEMALCLLRYGASPSPVFPAPPHSPRQRGVSERGRAFLLTAAAPRGPRATTGDSSAADDFHKLRFLQALLAGSFVTANNVSYLQHSDLLTSDLLRAVLAQLAQEGDEDTQGVGEDTDPETTRTSGSDTFMNDPDRTLSPGTAADGTSGPNGSVADTYGSHAVRSVCPAVRQSLTLRHQCRLAVREMLGTSLPALLPKLGLPQTVRDYISLGPDMSSCSPLDVVELHIAVTDNDVSKVRQLLLRGMDANLPLMERTPLTRALDLEPSHNDVTCYVTNIQDDVLVEERGAAVNKTYVCGLCHSEMLVTGISEEDICEHVENLRVCGTDKEEGNEKNASPQDDADLDVVSLLLRHGASVTLQDPLRDTPLHVAVSRGSCVMRRFIASVASALTTSQPTPAGCSSSAASTAHQSVATTLFTPATTAPIPVQASLHAPSRAYLGPSAESDTSQARSLGSVAHGNAAFFSALAATDSTASPAHGSDAARPGRYPEGWRVGFCDGVARTGRLLGVLDPTRSTDRLGLTPLELALLKGDMDTVRLLLALYASPPFPTTVGTGSTQNASRDEPRHAPGKVQGTNNQTLEAQAEFRQEASGADSTADNAHVKDDQADDNGRKTDSPAESVDHHQAFSTYQHPAASPAQGTDSIQFRRNHEISTDGDYEAEPLAETTDLKKAEEGLSHDFSTEGNNSWKMDENDDLAKLASWVGVTGVTALHSAAAAGLSQLANALLSQGRLAHSEDALGYTPLDAASCGGEMYRRHRASYCPHWYNDTWKSLLRVWPKCQPRPFTNDLKLRHDDDTEPR